MNKNVIGIFSTKVFSSAVNLAILLLTVKWMGAEQRGLISKFILELSFVMLAAEWVVGPVLIYYVSKHSLSSIVSNSLKWIVAVVLFSTLVIYFIEVDVPLMIYTSLFLVQCIFTFQNQLLLANQRFAELNVSQIVQSLIFLVFILIHLYVNKSTVDAYLDSLLISSLIAVFIQVYFVLKVDKRNKEQPLSFLEVFKSGSYTTSTNFFHLLTTRNSYILLGAMSTASILGVYSTAVSMSEAMLLAASSIGTFLYSKYASEKAEGQSTAEVLRFARYAILFTSLFVLAFFLTPSDVFTFVLGKDFTGVKDIILWLSPGILAMSLIHVFSHYFSARAEFRITFFAGLTSTTFILLCSNWAMHQWGLFGLTQATNLAVIGQLVVLVFFFIYVRKKNE